MPSARAGIGPGQENTRCSTGVVDLPAATRFVGRPDTDTVVRMRAALWGAFAAALLAWHCSERREAPVHAGTAATPLTHREASPCRVGAAQYARVPAPATAQPPGPSVATPPARRVQPPSARELLVLDERRRPVAGAEVAVGAIHDADGVRRGDGPVAVTDVAGRARILVATGAYASVVAPAHRLTHAKVPPPGEPWVVVIGAALRLEVSVVGPLDFAGLNARVFLPASCRPGPFHQQRYVTTPGRAVDGTTAWWEHVAEDGSGRSRRSVWNLSIPATGTAVLDQLEVEGRITIQLRQYSTVLEQREFEVDSATGRVRLQLTAPAATWLHGVVSDAIGRPIAGALLRTAPYGRGRIVDSPRRWPAFPVWAPECTTDAHGRFVLPRPQDAAERVVVTSAGWAARALTFAELDTLGGRIELVPGRTVRVEIVDCDGEALDGGWTTSGREYEEPSVLIGHDVWRGTRADELPWFEFAELPPGVMTLRCAGETLRHDARIPLVRFVTTRTVASMMIGK